MAFGRKRPASKKRRRDSSPFVRVRVPEEARWSCRSCARCCRLSELGPVSPDIIHGLEARKIGKKHPPAAAAPWYETRRAPDGTEAFFLTHRGDACVFLQEDNRCAVHTLFGADAKPAFCRMFPFELVRDPLGSVLVARPDCGGYPESHVDGEPLEDYVEDLFDLVALGGPTGVARFEDDHVTVLPGHPVLTNTWLEWEAQIVHDLAASPGQPAEEVARLRGAIAQRMGIRFPESSPDRFRFGMSTAFEALEFAMRIVKSSPARNDLDEARSAFARRVAARVTAARKIVDVGDGAAGPVGPLQIPVLSGEACAYFNLQLRQLLLAKWFRRGGSVAGGVGLHLVEVLVASVGQDDPGDTAAVTGAYTDWKALSRHPVIEQLTHKMRPALAEIFVHAAAPTA